MSIPTEQMEPPAAPEQQSQRPASFKTVLKNRNFLLLWCAQLVSLTILNAANYGIVAHVNDTTHSVFMSGLAIIAFSLPAVPFSAIAGVIVDHMNKRTVLWVSNILRMGTMLLVVVSLQWDRTNMWPLFALTFLTSLIGQFFIPAEGSSIPLMVGERELMPALSLFNITVTLSQAIGFLLLGRFVATIFPPFTLQLGTLVLHVQSLDMMFVLVAVLYVVCAVLILLIPTQAFDESHLKLKKVNKAYTAAGNALGTLWHDMVEGWHIVTADRLLFFSVVQLSVVGIIMQLIAELAGTFVHVILNRPAEDMSIILAPAAIGLVGASLVVPSITQRFGKLRLAFIAFFLLPFGFVALPITQWIVLQFNPVNGTSSPLLLWIIVLLVFMLGVLMACVNIPTQTLMQEHAPDWGRARVLSLQYMLYSSATIPILLFAGVVAQFVGFAPFVFLAAICIMAFALWGGWYIRGYSDKQLEPQTP